MKALHTLVAATAMLAGAAPALAQSNNATSGPLPVTGNVPALCSSGVLSQAANSFDLGVLVDTSTGFLLPTLSAPEKTLTGAFCSSRSTITIAATPMIAQNFTGAAPAGFSRSVHYVATASGWTEEAAVFATGAAANPAASRSRQTAFTGNIRVNVSDFTTAGGAGLRMVADPAYQGIVTLTLAVAS
jgi:hypothetical protein